MDFSVSKTIWLIVHVPWPRESLSSMLLLGMIISLDSFFRVPVSSTVDFSASSNKASQNAK